MNLEELYQSKLDEYNEIHTTKYYSKLLAILLLQEKYLYTKDNCSIYDFYEKYKNIINVKIKKIEDDFKLSDNDYYKLLSKEGIITKNLKNDKIWYIYEEGIKILQWALNNDIYEEPENILRYYYEENQRFKSVIRG